jgi:hypothetical protein
MLGNFLRCNNDNFLARANKKQNVDIDSPASGGQVKYMKHVLSHGFQ